jgi:asparagine synthase (glutamine-hydrolysing)
MIGILGKTAAPDEGLARRALAAVPYPTPDLAFRRLGDVLLGIATRPDFVDESLSAEGDMVAALCGKIDNAPELYRELSAAGTLPASTAGADVIVAAFRAHGPTVVNRLRGAFAGLVTDGRTLWSFRDHVGFRVLFWRDAADAYITAGEARQVVVAARIPEEPDLDVVERLYFGGMPSDTPAALKGVQRLSQGTLATVSRESGPVRERHWKPWDLLETARLSVDDAAERFLELLEQASVRSLTGKDVVFLSGGLDSPAVAAYAAPEHQRRYGRPIGAFSAVFPDLPDVDESALIEISARRYGMELQTYRPGARALDDVEEWSRRFGSPVPTLSIPEVWEAYSRVRALVHQNVLTGEFAEITYGKWPHSLSHLFVRGRWGALYRVMAAEHARGASRSGMMMDALSAFVPGKLANRYFVSRGQNLSARIPSWIEAGRSRGDLPRPDFLTPARSRWRDLQFWGIEGSTVTMEADATCAAIAGVTIRRPLADVDLWEFFLSLPAEIKFPVLQWKALARRALRGVIPDEVLDRTKKTYFDPHVMQQIDYPALTRLLVAPRHRIRGVDYDELARRISRQDLSFFDWISVRELARVHAFLSAW